MVRRDAKSSQARALVETFMPSGPRHVDAYCRELKSARRLSDFRVALNQAGDADDPADFVDRALTEFRSTGESQHMDFRELLTHTVDYLQTVSDGATGIPTGIPCLDGAIGGLQNGRLVVVAARPSVGKTALTLQISLNAAKNGHPVGICSLEMSAHELGIRALAQSYRINISGLFVADEEATGRAMVGMASNPMTDWPVKFNVDQYSMDDVVNQIRLWHKRDAIELAVVDHIGLIEYRSAKTPNERISHITRTLKKLAKELDIPIIAVSQLNRGNEKDRRWPVLSDLRDSGSIEQDADVCVFIHRGDQDGVNHYALGALKNRQGPAGWINKKIDFMGEYQIFIEIDGRYGDDY
jgi:replicative DNA helicase